MAQEETFHEKVIFEERRRSSMKKQRRIIAMILVLVVVFSLMAASASAATTEVQPRGYVCSKCGSSSNYRNGTTYRGSGSYFRIDNCPYNTNTHNHESGGKYYVIRCATQSCNSIVAYEYINYAQRCQYYGWY